MNRHGKPSGGFLRALQHVTMRDWAALRAKAKAEAVDRGYEGREDLALSEILKEERNKRKAARQGVRP